jgi:L-threonylcarbamoyladenylate synthase
METIVSDNIAQAAAFLKQGKVVGIPTETVYGLAALCTDDKAIDSIFAIKKRPLTNPLIVHISKFEDLQLVCSQIPDKAKMLAAAFWPGSLTLLLPKNNWISEKVTAGSTRVAVRVPNHPVTLKLLELIGVPLVAPSANPANRISPTTSQHVFDYFNGQIPMVVAGGFCEKGIESTIVGFEADQTIIYRLGAISVEAIEQVVGKVNIETHNKVKPNSPGQFSKHYAPETPFILTNQIANTLGKHPDKKIGLLLFDSNFEVTETIIAVKKLSKNADFNEAMQRVYSFLHELDSLELDIIIAEMLPEKSVGTSINDRLKRAANQAIEF